MKFASPDNLTRQLEATFPRQLSIQGNIARNLEATLIGNLQYYRLTKLLSLALNMIGQCVIIPGNFPLLLLFQYYLTMIWQLLIPDNLPRQLLVPDNLTRQLLVPDNLPRQLLVPDNLPRQLLVPDNLPRQFPTPDNLPRQLIVPDNLPRQLLVPDNLPRQLFVPDNLPRQLSKPDNLPRQLLQPENLPRQLEATNQPTCNWWRLRWIANLFAMKSLCHGLESLLVCLESALKSVEQSWPLGGHRNWCTVNRGSCWGWGGGEGVGGWGKVKGWGGLAYYMCV